ncbi:hypothetical protein PAXINDRAFT_17623 [Paxillus involutus ATCC 200175]|uniref:Uncharacterized protein n=1 Tax=Paxillus involutus ATCC 200175 TaxID=664439 RepID=A0A0C9TN80_PAXIN|nr:hypothetical protein PAXINDRAFT_17623 [Paxillus involutus ATCC 200175]
MLPHVQRTSWTWNGVRGHVDGLNETDYNTHPVILDAVFQRSAGLWERGGEGPDKNVYLPHSLKRQAKPGVYGR